MGLCLVLLVHGALQGGSAARSDQRDERRCARPADPRTGPAADRGHLAALPDGDSLSFTRLQAMIGLTPGNLITHLRKLEEADYVSSEKTGNGAASRTSVALTLRGRAALDAYTETLRGLLHGL